MFKHLGKPIQTGFSLVELMVAMTIGLALVAGVASLSLNSSQAYRTMSAASQQLESGRYSMEFLKDDLHHAGFFGEFVPCLANACRWQQANTPTMSLPTALPDPCTDDSNSNNTFPFLTGLANGLLLPLTGYDNLGLGQSDLSCINDLVAGTDVFVLRRADTTPLSVGDGLTSLSPLKFDSSTFGNTYIQATDSEYVIGYCKSNTQCYGVTGSSGECTAQGCAAPAQVTGTPGDVFRLGNLQGAVAPIRLYHVHIYYVRSWSTSGDDIPTLARVALTNTGKVPSITTEPLIEGIENMQVQYGFDDGRDAGGTAYGTALDGTPDRYAGGVATTTVADWSNVVAAKVRLLVRSVDSDHSYTDTKTYDLEGNGLGSIGPFDDHYQRHVFSMTAKLINVGTRRE
jgi:type IV pilus assembly protein PilW